MMLGPLAAYVSKTWKMTTQLSFVLTVNFGVITSAMISNAKNTKYTKIMKMNHFAVKNVLKTYLLIA